MKRGCTWLLGWLLLAGTAHADGLDRIYTADTLAVWQVRASGFLRGVYQEIITPAFTAAERQRLAPLQFDFPPSAPGREPLGFWRQGDQIHISAASMKFVADTIMAYVWLGRNHYQEASLDNYMLMLSCWQGDTPPAPPRTALQIPNNAGDDRATGDLAVAYTRVAWQFVLLHELGHVLHDPPQVGLDSRHTLGMEVNADRFALDMLGRLHQVPTGAAILFQIFSFYDAAACTGTAQAERHDHPSNSERLRQVALDIDDNAARYAKDSQPETLREFRTLSLMTQGLADQLQDPKMQADLRDRARHISRFDLLPVPAGH
jgi:hypothetical protein